MSLTIEQIAEAFCSYRYTEIFPCMADGIKWNIIGTDEFVGRETVIAQCNNAAKFLETVSPTITKQKIHRAEACVIVEGAAQFRDRDNQISMVASCDIFQFSDGRLVEITSYVIDNP